MLAPIPSSPPWYSHAASLAGGNFVIPSSPVRGPSFKAEKRHLRGNQLHHQYSLLVDHLQRNSINYTVCPHNHPEIMDGRHFWWWPGRSTLRLGHSSVILPLVTSQLKELRIMAMNETSFNHKIIIPRDLKSYCYNGKEAIQRQSETRTLTHTLLMMG